MLLIEAQGLYELSSKREIIKPYLPHWATLKVEAARPQHMQVKAWPILILSIRLVSLDEDSSPAHFLYDYLLPWFDGPIHLSLRYIDIAFQIRNTDHAKKYCAQWDEIFNALGK